MVSISMERAYYWNIDEEDHPKYRLLRYSKSSKISPETLRILSHLRKTYEKLPPIIYSLQDTHENEDITLENDIFDQHCNLSLKNKKAIWKPTSFYVSDSIYQALQRELLACKIDKDFIFLSLFPIHVDMNRKNQLLMGHQSEEIFLPSTIPSTQNDHRSLVERFHGMLHQQEALEIGLCPKRRRIYNDIFDELIRVIALQCSERGLLLARIKNEYVKWMNTYEELYASSMAYALRQFIYKMEEKKKYEYVIQFLEDECQQLRDEIENESVRFEKFSELINNNVEDNFLRKNVIILRSTNEILRRDVQNTLNNILLSPIFLGKPINYNKED